MSFDEASKLHANWARRTTRRERRRSNELQRGGGGALTRGLARTTGGDGTAAAQQEEQLIFFPPWTLEGTRRVDDSKGPEKREGEVFSHHAIGRPGLRLVFGQSGAPRDDDDERDAAGAPWKRGADHTNCRGLVRARGGPPTRPQLITPSGTLRFERTNVGFAKKKLV